MDISTIIFIIELIGIVSFSISGSVVAIDKEMDLVGVIFLAMTTCFGGGIMRDLIIGRTPVFFTSMWVYLSVGFFVSVGVFVFVRLCKGWYVKNKELVMSVNNYIDAAGLGAFVVSSVSMCMELCPEKGAFLAIMMGVFTAIGGGMIRDVCLRTVPFVLRKRIYAAAALAGAIVYYLLANNLPTGTAAEIISCTIGIIVVFTIRVIATVFKLNLPKAIDFSKNKEESKEKDVILKQ